MKIFGKGRNLFVCNKEAQLFDKLEINDSMLYICGASRVVKSVNKIDIYACLYCRELRNITLIVRGEECCKITFITEGETFAEDILRFLQTECQDTEFSKQDKKINGYSTALVEKMRGGTILTIIDTKDESDIIYCPECGVQCDPNIPYCMECGACVG